MFRHLLLAGAVLLLPLMAMAKPVADPAESLTLAQALDATRRQHPALKAIEAEQDMLGQRVTLAAQPPPVTLGVEVENFAGSDTLRGFDGAEVTLSLAKVLQRGGKAEARASLAGSQNELRRVELVQQRRDILADTAQRFIDAVIAQAELVQAEKWRDLIRATRKASQRRADAGAAPATELQRARLREQQAELGVKLARQRLDAAGRLLALALGQPESLPTVRASPLALPALVPLTELLVRASQVAAVQSVDARLRIIEAELRLTQAAAQTDLTLSGGIRHFRGSGDEALMVGVTLPLGSGRRAEPARLLAAGKQQVSEAQHEAATLKVKALVYDAWARLAAYRSQVEMLRDRLQAEVDAVVRATEAGYRHGRYSLLELNAAQADALNLARRRLQAAAGFHRTLIEIERLLGEPVVREPAS